MVKASPVGHEATAASDEGTFGSKFLRYRKDRGAAWLTIDRAHVRNAMSLEMYRGVRRAVESADADPEVQVTVITGVEDTFCVGGGLTAEVLFEHPSDWPGLEFVPGARAGDAEAGDADDPDLAAHVLPFDTIIRSAKPVISAVNGLCVGGGFIIALASDITLASDNAVFRIPEVLRGVPDPWIPVRLPAYVGLERAKYLMLTAIKFGAAEALEWGLVSEVVRGDLVGRVDEIVDLVVRGAPTARAVYKAEANRFMLAADPANTNRASYDERVEGFLSFAEKRPPAWIPAERAAEGRL